MVLAASCSFIPSAPASNPRWNGQRINLWQNGVVPFCDEVQIIAKRECRPKNIARTIGKAFLFFANLLWRRRFTLISFLLSNFYRRPKYAAPTEDEEAEAWVSLIWMWKSGLNFLIYQLLFYTIVVIQCMLEFLKHSRPTLKLFHKVPCAQTGWKER